MITGIRDVHYNVSDMVRAVRFYRDVLGLTLVEQSDHWSSFRVGALIIGLHWSEGVPVAAVPYDTHDANPGGTLTFATDAIDAALQRLHAHRVTVLGTDDTPWGRLIAFQDPDGNVLKIMAPPASP